MKWIFLCLIFLMPSIVFASIGPNPTQDDYASGRINLIGIKKMSVEISGDKTLFDLGAIRNITLSKFENLGIKNEIDKNLTFFNITLTTDITSNGEYIFDVEINIYRNITNGNQKFYLVTLYNKNYFGITPSGDLQNDIRNYVETLLNFFEDDYLKANTNE